MTKSLFLDDLKELEEIKFTSKISSTEKERLKSFIRKHSTKRNFDKPVSNNSIMLTIKQSFLLFSISFLLGMCVGMMMESQIYAQS